jgi:prepilin-type N-terminal cleavage/methylation domain-containing protein/prepilin-type processing-associated H-X9-DG protein
MRRRPGFTLIELLMVISIIALLVSLLLPAVQAARENARRVQCANNLMQLGIGLGSYASAHSVLPPGVVNENGPIKNLPFGYHHSWVVQILPFIGQGCIYDYVDQRASVYDPANDTVAELKIATLMCPSDNFRMAQNYAGCHHDLQAPIAADNHGVLYLNSHVAYRDITDGTAFTILLGEISGGEATLGWVSGTRSTLRDTGTPLNERQTAGPLPVAGKFAAPTPVPRDELFEILESLAEDGRWPVEQSGGFGSDHTLSSNFLFCDGSVRPVKKAVNREIYRFLGNRADGELVGPDQY